MYFHQGLIFKLGRAIVDNFIGALNRFFKLVIAPAILVELIEVLIQFSNHKYIVGSLQFPHSAGV